MREECCIDDNDDHITYWAPLYTSCTRVFIALFMHKTMGLEPWFLCTWFWLWHAQTMGLEPWFCAHGFYGCFLYKVQNLLAPLCIHSNATRTTIIYFRFYVFPFHIQIIEETTIENHVHKTMDCACHKQNRVPKTMVLNPWFCAWKELLNSSRACVKGRSTLRCTKKVLFLATKIVSTFNTVSTE